MRNKSPHTKQTAGYSQFYDDDDDVAESKKQGNRYYDDLQFEKPATKIPLKAIMYAIGLFVLGGLLLVFGILEILGMVDGSRENQGLSMIIIGSLLFIPGFYHVRIAYCAYHKVPGFDYDQIPEF